MAAAALARAVGALALTAVALHGQEEQRPSSVVVRAGSPPRIDGRLDDEVWKSAHPIGELTQIEPHEGGPPSEASDIRLLYDDDNLYIGVRCYDREPPLLVNTTRTRDALLEVDDRVELVIDTFHDRRNAFFFQINCGGSKGDALVTDNGENFNKPWDGIWDAVARIDDQGWTAEFALPFKTLNFAPGETTWGFNIGRFIGRKREEARWSGARRDYRLFQIYHAGELLGLEGMRQGIGLDVVPFFVSHWRNERDDGDKTLVGEPGLDAFYKILPSLTLSLTLNTDFAETEVDERRVNLTRFPLFFPERRDFFLQDAGQFAFADGDTALLPFFSRRIGLAEGQEIPILAGAKVTGRAADYNVGLLDVQTDDAHLDTSSGSVELDGRNLFAGRVSRNVGEQSTVGAIVTAGNPDGDEDNRVYGLDASFRTSDFQGDKNLNATVFWLTSESEDSPTEKLSSGEDQSYGATLSSPNDLWSWNLGFLEIQEDFRAKLGFVPRDDIRRYTGELGYRPRPDWSGIRQLEFGLSSEVFTDTGGELETWTAIAQPLGIEWESGEDVELTVHQVHDELFEDFEIDEGVVIPVGEYDYTRVALDFESARQRHLSVALGLEGGEFFDGDRTDASIGLVWQPGPLFNGEISYERNDVSLEDGSFDRNLALVRGNFSFSPELSWNNLVQWDDESDTIGVNSLLRWIPVPHQEVFLVLNETLENESSTIAPLFQELSFKITYAFRF